MIRPEAVRNPTFLQIIRCHFHSYSVAREDVNAVDPHTSRQVAEQFVIFGLWTQNPDPEGGVWKRLFYQTDEFYNILRHKNKQKKVNRKSREILQTELAESNPRKPKRLR